MVEWMSLWERTDTPVRKPGSPATRISRLGQSDSLRCIAGSCVTMWGGECLDLGPFLPPRQRRQVRRWITEADGTATQLLPKPVPLRSGCGAQLLRYCYLVRRRNVQSMVVNRGIRPGIFLISPRSNFRPVRADRSVMSNLPCKPRCSRERGREQERPLELSG